MLPILHSEHLEDCDEGHSEALIVCSWHLSIWTEVIVALEDLPTQQRVDENKHEHENRNKNEIHERALNDANDLRHRLEGSQDSRDSQHSESTEDSNRAESLQATCTTAAAKLLHDDFDDRKNNHATIEQVHRLSGVLLRASG